MLVHTRFFLYFVLEYSLNEGRLEKMNIIIVGAGASGLAAGISLLRNGNDVTILERNSTS